MATSVYACEGLLRERVVDFDANLQCRGSRSIEREKDIKVRKKAPWLAHAADDL
jgi:hypothetical protein